MKLRRRISTYATFILLFSLLLGMSSTVNADTGSTPVIAVQSVTALPGDTVDLGITITGNPGILGATLMLHFDSQLELLGVKRGAVFSSMTMTPSQSSASPCKFVWDGSNADESDGILLTLTFRVSAEAVPGASLAVTLFCESGDFVDADNNDDTILPTLLDGGVTVKASGAIVKASSSMEETTLTVHIESSGIVEDAGIILASYDESGRFLGCEIKDDLTFPAGKTDYSFPRGEDDRTYRAFVLDGEQRPLCPAVAFSSGDQTEPEMPEGLTLFISRTAVAPGSKHVAVEISIKENPGILGMTLSIGYDADVLTLVGADNGTAFSPLALTRPGEYKPACNFVWDGVNDCQANGVILTLYFDVAASAQPGPSLITLFFEDGDIVNAADEVLSPAVVNGAVTIQ